MRRSPALAWRAANRMRTSSRRCRSGAILCIVGAVLVGCGTDGESGDRSRPTAPMNVGDSGLPRGCSPQQTATLLTGLATAVADRRREKALGYISIGSGFVVITIYRGESPGAGRVDSRTPNDAYKNLVDAFGDVEAPKLLASVVGAVAPLEGARRGSDKDNPTAGVEFVIGLDGRSLSGKIGVDCTQGRIYLGAMNVRSGLRRQKACGSYVRLYADRPLVCSYAS